MAAGVPVVASAVGGVPEVVRHQETGLLTCPGQYQAIARWVRELLKNPDLSEKLRKAAYERVAKSFTTEAMLQQTYKLYGRVANG